MSRLPKRILRQLARSAAIFLSIFVCISPLAAQELADSARALARQIVISVGPGRTVGVVVRNASSLQPAQAQRVEAALVAELRSHGAQLVDTTADVQVRVTLSENLRSLVWTAEMERDGVRDVAIVTLDRVQTAQAAAPGATWSLETGLILESEQQILDVAAFADVGAASPRMLVLEPGRVVLFESSGGRWRDVAAEPIPPLRIGPRDLRGRLDIDRQTFWAYLPGVVCGGAVAPSFSMSCTPSDDPWPLHAGGRAIVYAEFLPSRNHFSGQVMTETGAQRRLPPFFTAAAVQEEGAWSWWIAGIDGGVHWHGAGSSSASAPVGLGSDITSLQTVCAGTWQVVAALAEPSGTARRVQAFRVASGQLVPVTQPVTFDGSITALWPAPDGGTAIVVARNAETGRYEAYRLAISCRP